MNPRKKDPIKLLIASQIARAIACVRNQTKARSVNTEQLQAELIDRMTPGVRIYTWYSSWRIELDPNEIPDWQMDGLPIGSGSAITSHDLQNTEVWTGKNGVFYTQVSEDQIVLGMVAGAATEECLRLANAEAMRSVMTCFCSS